MTAVADEATADAGPAPETTASGAGPATGDGADIGLTDEDLRTIAMAHAADLQDVQQRLEQDARQGTARSLQAVTDAEAELAEARSQLEGPQAVVDRLRARARRVPGQSRGDHVCRRRRRPQRPIQARSVRVAIAEETAELEERVRVAVRITDPSVVAVAAAERKLRSVRSAARGHSMRQSSSRSPASSGRATAPHRQYLLGTGLWCGSDSPEARQIIKDAATDSGIGAQLQEDAIRAYCAGDHRALGVGGTTSAGRTARS